MAAEQLTVSHLPLKDLIRIFNKISIDLAVQWNGTPCWTWAAHSIRGGYGTIAWKNRATGVHRLLYAWLVGPVPLGPIGLVPEIDHLCRNRACCNPAHLELVTRQENVLRGESMAARNAKKTHCKRGHEFSPDNSVYKSRGWQCKTCLRESALRRYYEKRRTPEYLAKMRQKTRERRASQGATKAPAT